MKKFLTAFIFLSSSILAQVKSFPRQEFYNLKLQLTAEFQSIQDESEFNFYHKRFFNSNLDFSNSDNSIKSGLKLTSELVIGGLTGYGCAMLCKNLFEPNFTKGEDWLGTFWQAAMIGFGAFAGTSGGTFFLGNILGDEGSFKNTFYWTIISGGIFNMVSGLFTKEKNTRLVITFIGLPVGAVIGFNSNDLL